MDVLERLLFPRTDCPYTRLVPVILLFSSGALVHCTVNAFRPVHKATSAGAGLLQLGVASGLLSLALTPSSQRRAMLPLHLSSALSLVGLASLGSSPLPVRVQLPTLLACSLLSPLSLQGVRGVHSLLLHWALNASVYLAPLARTLLQARADAAQLAADPLVTLDIHAPDFGAAARALACRHVPGWQATPPFDLTLTTISGGITNALCRLTRRQQGDSALVRVFGVGSEVLIDRARDNAVFARMAALGCGPAHYFTFGNGRLEGWVEHSRPLEPPEMASALPPLDITGMLARAMARLHARSDVEPTPKPWAPVLWTRLRGFEAAVAPSSSSSSSTAPSSYHTDLDWLEEVLPSPRNAMGAELLAAMAEEEGAARSPKAAALLATRRRAAALCLDVATCHNDLLAGNVLLVAPPGLEAPRVQLIDYEYLGPNFRAYEISNHFCEFGGFLPYDADASYPSVQLQRHFFEAYLEGVQGLALPAPGELREAFLEEMRRWVSLFCMASHMWCECGAVQARPGEVATQRVVALLSCALTHTHPPTTPPLPPSLCPISQGACGR